MSGACGGARVPIPNNAQNTINEIREITGNHHSSDEIYAALKECSMDPKETAQKLLYLDTFHEVRRRRKRRKEVLSSRVSEESRSKQHGQGRGARRASGGFSSNYFDGRGGRKLAIQRENGVHIAERTNGSSTQSDLQKITNTPPQASSCRGSAVAPHSAANLSNGKSGHGSSSRSLIGSVLSVPKTSSAANDTVNQQNIQPQAVVAVAAATSPNEAVGSITSTDQGKYLSSSDQCPPNHDEGNKLEEATDLTASMNEKSRSMNSTSNPNAILKLNEVESNLLSERLSSSLSLNSSFRPPQDVSKTANVTEVSASEAHVQSTEVRQHVTYPKHFHVPERLKGSLTFGSFNTFDPSERSCSDSKIEQPKQKVLLTSRACQTLNIHDPRRYGLNLNPTMLSSLDYAFSVTGNDSKIELPKQEVVSTPGGHPFLTVQSAQKYGLNSFRIPQFKAGANTGNMTPPVGYAPSLTVNPGSSSGNENCAVFQLKENQICTTGQLSEGSAVAIHALGQDISNLQVNSLHNLAHRRQHLTFPQTQAAPGAFHGVYQPGQTIASRSTPLQQSQAVAGPVESAGSTRIDQSEF